MRGWAGGSKVPCFPGDMAGERLCTDFATGDCAQPISVLGGPGLEVLEASRSCHRAP